jgi:ABC-type sulfate transport system permease component
VLVRYEFPGKRIIDALVDLPFACRPPWPASR